MNRLLALVALVLLMSLGVGAQNTFTKEQVMSMTEDQLLELSMEDFAAAIKAAGVSNPDELFAMIMNKNVSSASKADESTFDSPLSTSVLTHDEIRRFGCMSIEEAFRLIPGAIVFEKSNGIYDVHLRGLSNVPENGFLYNTENCNTLMMIDGRPVFNYSLGSTFWEALPIGIDDIDRIEVVRGPASALYGSNAVTGVINIITFKGSKSEKSVVGNISYGTNSTSTADVSIRKSLANDKLFIGISANMQTRERSTDKIYLIPKKGLYIVNDFASILQGKNLMYDLGYDLFTKTAVDNSPNIMEQTAMFTPIKKSRLQMPVEDLDAIIANGYITDMSNGGYVTLDQLDALRYVEYNSTQSVYMKAINAKLEQMGVPGHIPDSIYAFYNGMSDYVTAGKLYKDPNMSRENIGANAYVRFNPNENIDIYGTLGYQRSRGFSSSYNDAYYAMCVRNQETSYMNLAANIYGVNFQMSYWGGSQCYTEGYPGFTMDHKQLTGQLDYEFNLLKEVCGQSLKIRPGVSFVKYELTDKDYHDYAPDGHELPGYLNGTAKLNSQAAMLRFDYRVKSLRLIGAWSSEKLNIPDDWTHTWQVGGTYSITEDNCVRVVYGRANRSSFGINSSSNYTFDRTGMAMPANMTFLANEKADVMSLDNIEVGFRSRPTPRMLLDMEAFYSTSKDYGMLVSDKSQFEVSVADVKKAVANGVGSNSAFIAQSMFDMLKTRSYVQYQNVPNKVKQFGISAGFDWIATDKLIVKMNANYQHTEIDDYEDYSQTQAVLMQLTESAYKASALQADLGVAMANGTSLMKYFIDKAFDIPEEYYRRSEDDEIIGVMTEKMIADGKNPADYLRNEDNAYGFAVSKDMATVVLGSSSVRPEWRKENGHVLKSIPSFYGSLGMIYKPIEKLSVAADASYLGKREYRIKGPESSVTREVNGRFLVDLKIGYQPVSGFEVYFNARNLLNNEKREFVYADKIGGQYSIGASFEF